MYIYIYIYAYYKSDDHFFQHLPYTPRFFWTFLSRCRCAASQGQSQAAGSHGHDALARDLTGDAPWCTEGAKQTWLVGGLEHDLYFPIYWE